MVAAAARILALLQESTQQVVIGPAALAHMSRHRQRHWFANEAGGQLFGSISSKEVVISKATGPYRGDERRRFSYRSNPRSAQKAIDENAVSGLVYLGEWHTHPERSPIASALDHATILALHGKSTLRVNSLIMLIQGSDPGVSGLAIYSVGGSGVARWSLFEDMHA